MQAAEHHHNWELGYREVPPLNSPWLQGMPSWYVFLVKSYTASKLFNELMEANEYKTLMKVNPHQRVNSCLIFNRHNSKLRPSCCLATLRSRAQSFPET
ncbi:MAG: hypothetical protein WBI17_06850 [Clostridiaceae bacterium]